MEDEKNWAHLIPTQESCFKNFSLGNKVQEKKRKNDKKIEGRGVETKRKEKVKTAVSLLNPKTISKFYFVRMPKIRQLRSWTKGSRPSSRPLAMRLGLWSELPSIGFAGNFRFLDQKTARFSAKFPGANGLSKNVHLDLRINSQYDLNIKSRTYAKVLSP